MCEEFVLVYVDPWELENMEWNAAVELAIERDEQAASELKEQCNG